MCTEDYSRTSAVDHQPAEALAERRIYEHDLIEDGHPCSEFLRRASAESG